MSLGKLDKKIVVLMPALPPVRSNSIFEGTIKHKINKLRLKKQSDWFVPKSEAKNLSPSTDVSIVKKIDDRIRKLKKKSKDSDKKLSKEQNSAAFLDKFLFSPSREKKYNIFKERSLARRPHHMSFRNLNRPENSSRCTNNTPTLQTTELSENMILDALSHNYKPIKSKPSTKNEYTPFVWRKGCLKLHII